MPLTEILCAAPKYRRAHIDHPVAVQDCLDCAHSRENTCHFTYELLSSMYAQVQDRGERITTTTLTSKCLRSEYLKRLKPYSEKPEKMWASFRGTMYHGQLELHAAPGSVEEARYHVVIDGLGHLSGSPDLVDIRYGTLYDYKVTKEVPKFSYPWEDHVAQLNVNRWLVDNAWWVEHQGGLYLLDASKEDELWNFANETNPALVSTDVRENITRFRPVVWNGLIVVYMDDRGPKPIECTTSIDVPKSSGEGTKKRRVPDIWSNEKVEDFIYDRYREAADALRGKELPPIKEAFLGWAHPLCDFCPKKMECISLYFNGNEHERTAA